MMALPSTSKDDHLTWPSALCLCNGLRATTVNIRQMLG